MMKSDADGHGCAGPDRRLLSEIRARRARASRKGNLSFPARGTSSRLPRRQATGSYGTGIVPVVGGIVPPIVPAFGGTVPVMRGKVPVAGGIVAPGGADGTEG
jgi:hypothetical protein